MKSDEYVKFLTEQFVRYMETPRAERKRAKIEQRALRPPLRNELFGQIPNAIESYALQLKDFFNKKNRKPQ
ncbi:YqzE family protein [Sporolactobacillus putidus]|uniref:YqzE-like protein n=1 Tax=Sporolactobacillus putidus TaxID=492735 RepID=A0A917W4C9_9BACL|nr:YqzE family protein [Sporolactobacillus putidus]GGL61458.1 hypothetical protein GCM10007968_26810 [Sporolactobacillus putidus]